MSEIKNILVIKNEQSGNGKNNLEVLLNKLTENKCNIEQRILNGEDENKLFSNLEKFDCVIASGGDGTLASVANKLTHKNIPILHYPAGTANVMAHNIFNELNEDEFLDAILNKRTKKVDIGKVKVNGKERSFLIVAGMGMYSKVIEDSENYKDKLGFMAYIVSILKNIDSTKINFTIDIDGQIIKSEALSVIVANFGSVSYSLPITENINPQDGLLNIILLKGEVSIELVHNLFNSIKRKLELEQPVIDQNIEMYLGKKIKLHSDEKLPCQYDGEIIDHSFSAEFEIMPKAIEIFCTKESLST